MVPGLPGDDRLLEAGQQPLRIDQGQTQIGDIAEISRPDDLHDIRARSLTFSPGFHHPHNPGHPSTPSQRSDVKIPLGAYTPNSAAVPQTARETLVLAAGRLAVDQQ